MADLWAEKLLAYRENAEEHSQWSPGLARLVGLNSM